MLLSNTPSASKSHMEFVSVAGLARKLQGQITVSGIELCREVQMRLIVIYRRTISPGVRKMETDCAGNKKQER